MERLAVGFARRPSLSSIGPHSLLQSCLLRILFTLPPATRHQALFCSSPVTRLCELTATSARHVWRTLRALCVGAKSSEAHGPALTLPAAPSSVVTPSSSAQSSSEHSQPKCTSCDVETPAAPRLTLFHSAFDTVSNSIWDQVNKGVCGPTLCDLQQTDLETATMEGHQAPIHGGRRGG